MMYPAGVKLVVSLIRGRGGVPEHHVGRAASSNLFQRTRAPLGSQFSANYCDRAQRKNLKRCLFVSDTRRAVRAPLGSAVGGSAW